MPTYEPGVTFTDVPVGHWAEADIAFLYNRGLVSGFADHTFRGEPATGQRIEGHQTRYETAAFMARNARESERIVTDIATRLLAIEQRLVDLPGEIAQEVQQGMNSAVNLAVQAVRTGLRVDHTTNVTVPSDGSPVNSGTWNAPHRITLP